jgi:hypothetical protein
MLDGIKLVDQRKKGFRDQGHCKWWWLLEKKEDLWQDIVNLKYVKSSLVCLIPNRSNDSPVQKYLMKVRHIYLRGRDCTINNRKKVSFWLDPWMDNKPLCQRYPILYELCLNQNSLVFDVIREDWSSNSRSGYRVSSGNNGMN